MLPLKQKVEQFIESNPKFNEYLTKQNIKPQDYKELLVDYAVDGRRCVRLRGQTLPEQIRKELEYQLSEDEHSDDMQELQPKQKYSQLVEVHPLFADLVLVPREIKINHLESFKCGDIVGIEASSALIVKCLGIDATSRVLDMCCSPGAKLMYIADLVKHTKIPQYHENVVGCDISYHRSQICKSLLAKHGHPIVRVLRGDSTKIREILGEQTGQLFKPNKVLVDVECTHEGSLKHILKFITKEEQVEDQHTEQVDDEPNGPTSSKKLITSNGPTDCPKNSDESVVKPEPKISNKERKRRLAQKQKLEAEKKDSEKYFSQQEKPMEWGVQGFTERVLDEKKLDVLFNLQTELLLEAMYVCEPGGEVIYSTCSLMKSQNEDVLTKALSLYSEKKSLLTFTLEDSFAHLDPEQKTELVQQERFGVSAGSLKGTYYLKPNKYTTGGMFVSRLIKSVDLSSKQHTGVTTH